MNGCDLHGVSPPKCYIYTTCQWMDVIFMVFHHLNVIYIYIYNLSMNGCDLHGVSPPKCYIYTTCL